METSGLWLINLSKLSQTFTQKGECMLMAFTGMGKPYLKMLRFTEEYCRLSAGGEPLLWNAINAFIHYFSLKINDFSLKKNRV